MRRRSTITTTSRSLCLLVAALITSLAIAACGSEAPPDTVAETEQDGDAEEEDGAIEEPEAEPEPERELVPVTFRLNFAADTHHAPYHLAYERGYYEDEGLDVRVLDGTGSGDAITLVGAGADTFGLTGMTVMGVAVAQEDVPVTAIGGHIQRIPDAIFALGERGIESLADLDGTVAGWTPGSTGEVLFPAVAAAAGVDPDFEQATMDGGAKRPALLTGDVDWITGFALSQIPIYEEDGVDINVIFYSDYITVLGLGFITSIDVIENQPDVVSGFMRASMRGVQSAMEDPAAAVDALVKHRPAIAERGEANLRSLELWIDHVQTERGAGEPLGWMHPEDWAETVEIMQEYMDMPELADIEALYTNDFIDSSVLAP